MNIKSIKHLFYIFIFAEIWACGISVTHADSDLFPPQENAPELTSYVSGGTFKHTYYLSPTGNDTTGNGSINNPWLSFRGATSGGNGVPVAAGDILYFRGGVYPTHAKVAWKEAYYALKRSGTATDYIVFTSYPGETPQFTGGEGAPSFSIHGNYIVIDGLTFNAGGNLGINRVNNIVLQNLSFSGCADGYGDQNRGTCIGIGDFVDQIVIRNNYFGPDSQNHAVKSYTSESVASNVQVLYNRFNGITTGYGVINHKSPMQNWEYAYNRFQDCSTAIEYGLVYDLAIDTGANIHNNVFDNCEKVINRGDAGTKDLRNFQVHDNVILGSSGKGIFLGLGCYYGTACLDNGQQAMGEFYNNVIYDVADAIDPETTSDFTNYPSYWNYNAYRSSTVRSSAENQNNLNAANWDGNALIITENQNVTSDDIYVMGNTGNRFYYVADDSQLRNNGRYGGSIGGFTWGNDPARPMPPTLR